MNFYEEELKPYQKKIMDFIDSEAFQQILEAYNGAYFMDTYGQTFKDYIHGGKCVRGYLVKLGFLLAGGAETEEIVKASAAYEIFEAAILAHDDIIDQSPLRRGVPSMYVTLGNDHLGEGRTICVGDVGILMSNVLLSEMHLQEHVMDALKLQNKIYLKTISGELLDIDLSEKQEYTEDDIISMYAGKTAWYTIIGPLLLGATLAGADAVMLEKLTDIGYNLGVAFQIKDDLLGIFSKEEETGKSVSSDAIEGKKSILTSYFNEHAGKEQKEDFYRLYGHAGLDGEDLAVIKKLLQDSGAYDYTNERMTQFYQKAVQLISAFSVPEEQSGYKEIFEVFARFLIERKK